jgi:hypothetical protein
MSSPIDPHNNETEVVHVQSYDPYDPTNPIDQTTYVEDVIEVRSSPAATLTRVIWLALAFLEALIGLRIIMLLIGASPSAPFAYLVYAVSGVFLWPFAGMISSISADGVFLEVSSFIAMFVYALLAWGLVEITWLIFGPAKTHRTITRHRDY